MLVNTNKEDNVSHVKFVSYTGKWPNLCSGILTLIIDGETVRFGYGDCFHPREEDKDLLIPFWSSGGCCGFRNNYSDAYTTQGPWIIDVQELPEKYRKYAEEIDEVFNDNVDFGCCGGCL